MSGLTGTARLLRLALRRDRFVLPAWVLGIAVLLAAFTAGFVGSLPTQADVLRETQFMAGNAGFRMLSLSPGASIGAYTMSRGFVTLAILAAVMSILCVVRHTRQSEENGRAELLRAGVVGSAASLTAAVIVALTANVLLAPLLGLAMIANGQPIAGSFAAGAAIAGVGVAFTGVAAVTSQLTRTARAATGLAVAALGVSFVVSGVGNMLGGVNAAGVVAFSAWPSWISPIGWGYQFRPFGDENWWLLGLFAAAAGISVAAALGLALRRDLGAGALPERPGRDHASALLQRPLGLAWRLQRPAFLGWLVALVGFGLIFGSVSDNAGTLGDGGGYYEHLVGNAPQLDAWFTSMIAMAGAAAVVYAVQVLRRLREEEAGGRLEPTLSAAVSRSRWVMSHLLVAIGGAALLLLAFATSMALAAGPTLGDTVGLLKALSVAALAELPAVIVLAGAVVALFALLPRRAAPVAWLLVIAAVLLGPLFDLGVPQWLCNLSPLTHQKAPGIAVSGQAIVALLAVAAGLVAAGLLAFRRRDVQPG